MTLGLVASGFGVTLLPKSVASIATSEVKFVPLALPETPASDASDVHMPELQIAIAWLKHNNSPRLNAFIETARSSLA